MGWWLAFAVFLYMACAILLIAEVFIPSGGLLTVCAIACVVSGGYLFFQQSTIFGVIGVITALIMVPVVLVVAYKLFPHTRFGRSVTLRPPDRRQGDAVPDSDELKGLMGVKGVVLTPLRPVGMCDFSGRRVECVAESGYVDKEAMVKVIAVDSTQVTVRITEDN